MKKKKLLKLIGYCVGFGVVFSLVLYFGFVIYTQSFKNLNYIWISAVWGVLCAVFMFIPAYIQTRFEDKEIDKFEKTFNKPYEKKYTVNGYYYGGISSLYRIYTFKEKIKIIYFYKKKLYDNTYTYEDILSMNSKKKVALLELHGNQKFVIKDKDAQLIIDDLTNKKENAKKNGTIR